MARPAACVLTLLALLACSSQPTVSPPAPLRVEASFDSGASAKVRPPDAAIAASPTQLLVATNGGVRLLKPDGSTLASAPSLTAFFSAVLGRGAASDPRAIWDPVGRRFIISAFTLLRPPPCRSADQCGDRVLVAVSRSDAPASLDGSQWRLVAEPLGGQNGFIETIDFPALAVTPTTVVLTANGLSVLPGNSAGITHELVRLFDRAALENDPANAAWHDLVDLRDAEDRLAAHNLLPAQGGDRVLLVATGNDCRVRLWAVDGSPDSPSVSKAITGAAGDCSEALNASQPGAQSSIEVGGSALYSTPTMRDRRLWLAATVAGKDRLARIRWAEVDVTAFPNVKLIDQGYVAERNASNFEPALLAGPRGSMVLVFAASGASRPLTIEVTGRGARDGKSVTRKPVPLHASAGTQNPDTSDPSQRNRFGDYYAATADPEGQGAWVTGEYFRAPDEWGLWVGRIAFP